jgi:hypothetical protein
MVDYQSINTSRQIQRRSVDTSTGTEVYTPKLPPNPGGFSYLGRGYNYYEHISKRNLFRNRNYSFNSYKQLNKTPIDSFSRTFEGDLLKRIRSLEGARYRNNAYILTWKTIRNQNLVQETDYLGTVFSITHPIRGIVTFNVCGLKVAEYSNMNFLHSISLPTMEEMQQVIDSDVYKKFGITKVEHILSRIRYLYRQTFDLSAVRHGKYTKIGFFASHAEKNKQVIKKNKVNISEEIFKLKTANIHSYLDNTPSESRTTKYKISKLREKGFIDCFDIDTSNKIILRENNIPEILTREIYNTKTKEFKKVSTFSMKPGDRYLLGWEEKFEKYTTEHKILDYNYIVSITPSISYKCKPNFNKSVTSYNQLEFYFSFTRHTLGTDISGLLHRRIKDLKNDESFHYDNVSWSSDSVRGTTTGIGTILPTNTVTLTRSPRDASNINIGDYLTINYGDTRGLFTHQVSAINRMTETTSVSLPYTPRDLELIGRTPPGNSSLISARPNPRLSSRMYATEVEEMRRNRAQHRAEIRTEAQTNNLLQQLLRRSNES